MKGNGGRYLNGYLLSCKLTKCQLCHGRLPQSARTGVARALVFQATSFPNYTQLQRKPPPYNNVKAAMPPSTIAIATNFAANVPKSRGSSSRGKARLLSRML